MIDGKELLRLLRSGCAVTPHQIQAADEIESLRGKIAFLREGGEKREARVEELEQRIQDREDKFNAPCADALQKLWEVVMPDGYGDWEYPGMAYRHLKAEFDDRVDRIAVLEEKCLKT
jgi:predicted nuclease with TOPRIM domain